MGTDVGAVGTVGNRHGGTLEARVRGGVDPPTWRPGSAARQGRVREGTPRTGGDVRVGCAKDVVLFFLERSRCLWCTAPPRARLHCFFLAFVRFSSAFRVALLLPVTLAPLSGRPYTARVQAEAVVLAHG